MINPDTKPRIASAPTEMTATAAKTGLGEEALHDLVRGLYGNVRSDPALCAIFDRSHRQTRAASRSSGHLLIIGRAADRARSLGTYATAGRCTAFRPLLALFRPAARKVDSPAGATISTSVPNGLRARSTWRSGRADRALPGIENPIAVLRGRARRSHGEVAEIRRLTRNLVLPKGACATWSALYAGLAEFIDDLTEHTRLENDTLFPQFETAGREDA